MSELTVKPIIKRNKITEDVKTGQVLNEMDRLITDEIKESYRKNYKLPEDAKLMSQFMHNRITGIALHSAKYVMQNGGTKAEVFNVLMYLAICIDSNKHHLDYKKAYKDWNIGYLREKYGAKRPKKTE